MFQAMDEQFPGVGEKLLDEDGHVKRFINVFVNDDEIARCRHEHAGQERPRLHRPGDAAKPGRGANAESRLQCDQLPQQLEDQITEMSPKTHQRLASGDEFTIVDMREAR